MNALAFSNTTIKYLTNTTLPIVTPYGWTPLLIAQLCLSCISVVLNVTILLLQLLPQTKVTAFTIYLICISIGNIVVLLPTRTIGFLNFVTGRFPGGQAVCAFYVYSQMVVSMIPVLVHVLIAVNRLWAVTHPVSYRQRHNKNVAVLLCIAVMAYVHILIFPVMLVEFYHAPAKDYTTCQPGAGAIVAWRLVDFILHRMIPLLTILVIYVYVMLKRWRKGRVGEQAGDARQSTDPNDNSSKPMVADKNAGDYAPTTGYRSGIKRRKVKPFVVNLDLD
ncbi:5-hydroxytryptamine receptor 1B-like [Paramacrobiotus metropolitanus]|uniref:5-hydroxytryptamine receptor 1B-like n=1 Tax=Paramacrobiotus metropolitanus TaxID=2943436 RepID=UPI0024455E7D|nr:5-hydroxytryptamine receptor 1B-like [Paramacrobiotus metropolitanus]